MWTLNKVHQVAELVAAVAVVLSLLFVVYVVQQNSAKQTQAATVWALPWMYYHLMIQTV